MPVPTGKPEIMRPPLMQSSIAISSAMRIGGLYSAIELPSTMIATSRVRRVSVAAIRFGEGIMP